ncbi:MAG TPA: acyltransferase, partial [Candidatus Limnocylindria bacterium]|nr:acyltransferase [Candidatus Limnocylindria bacterium]
MGSLTAGERVTGGPRLHYLDWLRVVAIASVFVFHTLRPFGDEWHVNNAERSQALEDALFFFWTFGLALLFLVAGAGVRFALRRRDSSTFVRERFSRLLVPFAVGTLLLAPPQAFIEAVHKGADTGRPLDFIGRWGAGVIEAFGRGISPTVFGVGFHLWFLGFLFAISIVALPVCRLLLSGRGLAATTAWAERSGWRGASLVFAVPIAIVIGIAAPFSSGEHDWFEVGWYLVYFVNGFVLFSDERFIAAVRRDAGVALAIALASTVALARIDMGAWAEALPERGIDWSYPAMGGLFAV